MVKPVPVGCGRRFTRRPKSSVPRPLVRTPGPVYQPPGANLTYGDVTHGQRVQSASSNPAAAAADLARAPGKSTRGTLVSVAAGLEYGNVQDLFDFYDELTQAYEPGDPGDGGDAPGQNPDDKPDGGIDLGEIWDSLDPDFQAAVKDVAREVATQTALLALIRKEGYGKAWVAADVPFVLGERAPRRGLDVRHELVRHRESVRHRACDRVR